jgi:hypothetical protein
MAENVPPNDHGGIATHGIPENQVKKVQAEITDGYFPSIAVTDFGFSQSTLHKSSIQKVSSPLIIIFYIFLTFWYT